MTCERNRHGVVWLLVLLVVVPVAGGLIWLWWRWQEQGFEPTASRQRDRSDRLPQSIEIPLDLADEASQVPDSRDKVLPGDALQRIEGIGPKIAALLAEQDILSFEDLAAAPTERLRAILDDAGLSFTDPTTWPEQATLAADARWPELDVLQEELKGGRRVD